MSKLFLVTGATGNQGRAVADALLGRGHRVRALVRTPDGDKAKALASQGAELAKGDFGDPASIEAAARGTDGVFAMSSPFVAGVEAETAQGKAIVDAAKAAGVPHLVYSSVADAQNATGIPHFDSKWGVEEHLKASWPEATVTAPVYFYENILFPWNIASMKAGTFRQALPANRKLQMVSVKDIGRLNALALAEPERFAGKRIDYAGDELTGDEMAAVLSKVTGRAIAYEVQPMAEVSAMSDDLALMYQWFDRVGYSADIPKLKADYAEVEWLSFEAWAKAQDWDALFA